MNRTEPAGAAGTTTKAITVFRLIYRSRSTIAPEHRDVELGKIFRIARVNNAAKGITGALLVYEDLFAQTLEGEESPVRALFAHIEKDGRHRAVEILESGLVPERAFSRWAMASVGEHGEPDIPLIATTHGVAEAAARRTTGEQDHALAVMRDATRGYGRGY